MRNTYIKSLSLLLAASLSFVACDDQDEFTGDSVLKASQPQVSLNYSLETVTNLTETNMKYPFSISIDQAVAFDVVLKLAVTSGTATAGSDYNVPNEIKIAAGNTTGSSFIEILSDDLVEDTESFTVSIGQSVINGIFQAKEVTFNIANLESGDLSIDLSWSLDGDTTDNSGNEIGATDFADLRLLVSSAPNNIDLIGGADGGSFENFVLKSTTPDGEYFIVADFYAANEDIIRDINLELGFSQVGINDGETFNYEKALNNAGTCDLNFYVLTKIIKTGSSYTFEDVSTQSYELSVYTERTNGFDSVDAWSPEGGYPSELETKDICDGFFILGINAGWMLNSWGEEIQPDSEKEVFAKLDADGTFIIESQPIFETLYKGDLYPYSVSGSGTYDSATGELTIKYYLDQDGFDVSGWMNANGYMDTAYFEAIIEQ